MEIILHPIGRVRSARVEAIDDGWDSVESWIELDGGIPEESVCGLGDFSHIEVLYYFDKVDPGKITFGAEHPRENPEWPKVGIFAQRKKSRPNLIGATIVRLVRLEGRKLYVSGLDAIDGTPVLDIKPVFNEYLPAKPVVQPFWVGELMANYW
jgi:tRNA-Thr(GGU) m(6)t(6)A37 methyltransferase TsaA